MPKSPVSRARITPSRYGGFMCVANNTLVYLKKCPSCLHPMTTMSKVVKESRAQGKDGALTWLAIVASGVRVMEGERCSDCAESSSDKN